MKIAISGKGGVGKTTLAALLIKYFRDQGKKVLAVDADPDANLALALGVPDPENIVPLSQMKEMVAERTESQPGKMGGFFKMNPKVDDIPEKYSRQTRRHQAHRHGRREEGRQRLHLPGERAAAHPGDPHGAAPG